ncbi:septation protein SepH [Microbacterium luticocti]|uniref:septation protein SepH n=1 Tax=Microbacterium luticocti TaxID=451764 RepID=UPI0004276051|nr:septation protein SepH [Microbacterium luticocti]
MEQLRVIGSEDDALVLATETGQRFTLVVDDVLRAELKRRERTRERAQSQGPRPSPRDIQARVRAGLTAAEVAEALGITVEDVTRYEGPVLAEREHMVGQALAVPVLVAGGLDDPAPTFGGAVRAKLAEAGATGERWTSWKDENGWHIKLEFTAGEVDHDARWSFDPRRSTLSPLNGDAAQLSRQGSLPEGLIPRLRALDTPQPKDDSRFDAGAFGPRRLQADAVEAAEATHPAIAARGAAQDAAIKRAPEQSQTSTETADLLEALRRRRGQRAPLPTEEQEQAASASTPVALFDALEPGYEHEAEREGTDDRGTADRAAAPGDRSPASDARRKGRTAMPSWDEIVFGARTDDT